MVLVKHGVGGCKLLDVVVMGVVIRGQRRRARAVTVVQESFPVDLSTLKQNKFSEHLILLIR